MGRNKLNIKDKKAKLSITINSLLYDELNKFPNKSKYIEFLIYKDLMENKIIDKKIIL